MAAKNPTDRKTHEKHREPLLPISRQLLVSLLIPIMVAAIVTGTLAADQYQKSLHNVIHVENPPEGDLLITSDEYGNVPINTLEFYQVRPDLDYTQTVYAKATGIDLNLIMLVENKTGTFGIVVSGNNTILDKDVITPVAITIYVPPGTANGDLSFDLRLIGQRTAY